jgi:putative endonuclease
MMNNQYYFVYLLRSLKDGNFYTGFTRDLNKRIKEHDDGNVLSTKNRRPLILVYFECSLNQKDATRREKYLKTAWGKRYLKNRIKDYLTG